MSVYDTLRLLIKNVLGLLTYIATDKFYIQPVESDETLLIDRVSYDISIVSGTADIPSAATSQSIYGVIGVIRLIAGPCLIVITDRALVGELNGQLIWSITKTEIFPYVKSQFHLNDKQQQWNRSYESMLKSALNTPGLYYSCTYDLTHTLQRLHNTSPEFTSIPLAERADQRFVWNHHLLREFQQQSTLNHFCLPIMCGFVAIKPVSMKGYNLNYILISRRSVFRAGTRYTRRGLDVEGHAANYVETEQIIEYDYMKCSFVQTRGSMPYKWSQNVNLKYKPKAIVAEADHISMYNNHFNSQVYNYGKQVLVNLVNLTGLEGRLANTMEQMVKISGNPNVRYEEFDFHKECGQMNWGRLSILIDRLSAEHDQFGYFVMDRDGNELSQQKGVFRVNCMDCLDRTNVVESLLAKRTLKQQLTKLGILSDNDQLEHQTSFDYIFRNVWADNADMISVQYAGTGALKTDFTRTGKRTIFGLIMDGINSATRYIKNNFSDGYRQDSIDLFLGNYVVDEREGTTKSSPLNVDKDWKFYTVPVVLVIAIAMLSFTLLLPGENMSEQLMPVGFWGMASMLAAATIYLYGKDFVDVPKLCNFEERD